MELPNFNIARTELKDLHRGPMSQHFRVEIALLDRSQHSSLFPQVFQLKKDYRVTVDLLDWLRQEFSNFERDAFKLVGEALQIDPLKKLIILTDDNMISYKYLVVVTSPSNATEFDSFLPTLKDVLLLEALNVKAKIAENSIANTPSNPSPFQSHPSGDFTATEGSSSSKNLSSIVQPCMDSQMTQAGHGMHPKKLCQVKT